jgi:hypothetical protein
MERRIRWSLSTVDNEDLILTSISFLFALLLREKI